ncbi:hypothetical protein C900_00285 [Fulvivirga imtechensis AK7]|uniref:Lipocalin-like domain-containing protein n=1 Tax=Fulvivirga imtechensis AK7 TaxID=1237149 RepID=L8JLY7_9BACT|nr:hypothetical protein [Fulvivirga imtechensis]ELR68544.1 hypothetical protein C900_00285 [Fulvivirga imtechensis AK7]
MKSILKSFAAAALLITTACSSDDVEDLVTTTITTSLTEEAHITVGETDPLEYSESFTFDASAAVANLKIDNYEITKLTIAISNYTGLATEISKLTFSIEGTNLERGIENIDFASYNNKGPIEVQIDDNVQTAIAGEFTKNNKTTLNVTAALDDKPADFDLKITIEGKVKGSLMK